VKWYLAKGCKVTGIDITETSVHRLQATLPGEFHTRDITDANYPRGHEKFDLINVWDVIYHIVDNDAFGRALNNILSELKDGGLLLLTDFLGAALDARLAPHVLGRCLKTYEIKLHNNGFELVEVRPLVKFLAKSHLGHFDNYLGSVYYFLDNLVIKMPTDNLSLSVWRHRALR
jgi:SAM-dependent methyltransferase